MPAYTRLYGVDTVDKYGMMEQLNENLQEFFNWGLLEAGGFINVGLESNYDLDDNTLHPKSMANIPPGRIWQCNHRNWVWESGLESTNQPIAVSGVYVNGTFHSSASTDAFKHHIDYPEGRVIFDAPIPTSSVVQVEYSYKWMNIYDQTVTWFRDVIFDAMIYKIGDSLQPSGGVGLLQQDSIQLPAIIVESVPSRKLVPKQLGDLSQWIYQDFLIHIITENLEDRDFMIDVFMNQKDVTFYLFDTNERKFNNTIGLDLFGSKNPNGIMYPQLVEPAPIGYRWKKCRFTNMVGQDSSAYLPLYRAIVRTTLEVDSTFVPT